MRLSSWDYRRPGPYAVTICTEHRWHLFDEIIAGPMIPTVAGALVTDAWGQMAEGFPPVAFDAWVLMPNHLHAIVRLPGTGVRLGDLVQGFKGPTTARYAKGVHTGRWEPFDGRLWQRNYHEHIVHAQVDLDRGRRYIRANSANWASDVDREPDMPMLLRACDIPRPPAD